MKKKKMILDLRKIKFIVKNRLKSRDIGDYRKHNIYTIDTKDKIKNNAILLHEFIEALIIYAKGLNSRQIDFIDMRGRKRGESTYDKAHRLANKVEKIYIEACGRSWKQHQKEIDKIE